MITLTREQLIQKITKWEMEGRTSSFSIPAYHWQLEMIKEVVNGVYDVDVTGEGNFLCLVTIKKKEVTV